MKLDMHACFNAYDVRGLVTTQLTTDVARRIGYAYGKILQPEVVAVGQDIRHSSAMLAAAVIDGLLRAGVTVWDIGLTGTEELYFAVVAHALGGGIMITGSHNPKAYNGIKFVQEAAKPISSDSSLNEIRDMAERVDPLHAPVRGEVVQRYDKSQYVEFLVSKLTPATLRPLRIVANTGNGVAGPIINLLEQRFQEIGVPVTFIKLLNTPDGDFPQGIPNPLLPENRDITRQAVRHYHADLGLAWDGDFDRCFFFDETGAFIEGYYLVGLLAEAFLHKKPGSTIIHDPRLTWNTIDIVTKMQGKPVASKTGHAFMKESMRKEHAIYGGEMSAHHYFSDFNFCDSGMLPWLLVIELMSAQGQPLSVMVGARQALFPCSGEINYRVGALQPIMQRIEDIYTADSLTTNYFDGLSMEMPEWRFNLRMSNTEPLLRLNVETRGDARLVHVKRRELEKWF